MWNGHVNFDIFLFSSYSTMLNFVLCCSSLSLIVFAIRHFFPPRDNIDWNLFTWCFPTVKFEIIWFHLFFPQISPGVDSKLQKLKIISVVIWKSQLLLDVLYSTNSNLQENCISHFLCSLRRGWATNLATAISLSRP